MKSGGEFGFPYWPLLTAQGKKGKSAFRKRRSDGTVSGSDAAASLPLRGHSVPKRTLVESPGRSSNTNECAVKYGFRAVQRDRFLKWDGVGPKSFCTNSEVLSIGERGEHI